MKNNKDLQYLKIFIVSFVTMIFILLPNIIMNQGVFWHCGDYSAQMIPFYYHAAEYVNQGEIGWDWYTDIGSDFLCSYSYYLTGSVFFWIVSWMSGKAVIYMMPFMIAFKTAVGALGAYIYIQQYVRKNNASFLGAFMYAFSGFQMCCLVFYTFFDITALFPFYLFFFDKLVKENKKIGFTIMVSLIACTNYFFFFGIVVFTVLYYIVKCLNKEFEFAFRSFLSVLFEALLGTGIAAVILIPTFLMIASSDRIGDTLYGVDLIAYNDNTIVPKIVQSLFLIPDPPSCGMIFQSKDNTHNWASISLYLPVFTVTGVVVYLKNNSRDWISKILALCLMIALIPGLNSVFYCFNSSYYARWFYMPVLIMCLASAKSLDYKYNLTYGIKVQALAIAIISFIALLPDVVYVNSGEFLSSFNINGKMNKSGIKALGMTKLPVIFWQCIAFAIVFLMVVIAYNSATDKRKIEKKISLVMVGLVIITNVIYINTTIDVTEFDSNATYNASIGFEPKLKDDDDIYRITNATSNTMMNYSMMWKYMNIECFHSVEVNEIDDFYYNVQGEKRMMYSQYTENDYPVYGLLSVKYIFNRSTNDDLNVEYYRVHLKGCSLYDKQGSYYIYKNDCFVPLGFMYDYCIDDETLEEFLNENVNDQKYQYKKLVMMRALVLDKADIEKYRKYIVPIPENKIYSLNEETYYSDCKCRRDRSCSSFDYDAKGYKAEITTDRPGLVYFSVPCSNGWTAKVNGKDVEIIKAHYGLTAIPVEAGKNKIECSYKTPGLEDGKMITFISLSVLILYVIANIKINKRKNSTKHIHDCNNSLKE